MWKYRKLHLDKDSELIIFFYPVAPNRLPWIYIIFKTCWMGKWTKWLDFEIWLYLDNGHKRTALFLPLRYHFLPLSSSLIPFYPLWSPAILGTCQAYLCLSVFAVTVPSVCVVLPPDICRANLLRSFKYFLHYHLNGGVPSLS